MINKADLNFIFSQFIDLIFLNFIAKLIIVQLCQLYWLIKTKEYKKKLHAYVKLFTQNSQMLECDVIFWTMQWHLPFDYDNILKFHTQLGRLGVSLY